MEEIFDEARRCPTCDVVTYCDTCPICGKKLPRSAHVSWRLFHGIGVAGEDEVMLQPSNYEIHRDHIKQREIKVKPLAKAAHTIHDDHVEPDLSISSDQRPDSVFQNFKQKDDSALRVIKIASMIAIVSILILIVFVVALSDESDVELGISNESEIVKNLEEAESIPDNHGDIQFHGYAYDHETKENRISITNQKGRSFTGDLVLLNEDGQSAGVYENLFIYPYEDFELTLFTNDPATSYKFRNSEFYEINSTKPSFEFISYENYGAIDIEVGSVIERNDLEILVKYLYEASTHDPQGDIYSCDVYMSDHSKYDVFISEGVASVYLFDKNEGYVDDFDFKLSINTDKEAAL